MSRLPRPYIPLAVRYRVALRQLGRAPDEIDEMVVDAEDRTRRPRFRGVALRLKQALRALEAKFGCDLGELRLDHDPALENREKLLLLPDGSTTRSVIVPKGAEVICYFPDANDPDHLRYRPHGAEHEGSHDVKTRIRGDHGQLSDAALLRKEKRRVKRKARKKAPRRGRKARFAKSRKIPSRPFSKGKRPLRPGRR